LQSSRDGSLWTDIARVDAVGTTNQSSSYSFTENNLSSLIYYRLVQVDFDGTSEIYGPISVKCDIEMSTMTAHPNPSSGDFAILIESHEKFDNAIIELTDLSGRKISAQYINIILGSNLVKFDQDLIQSGTYIVRILGKNDVFSPIRIVVL
jgi:hypothetical protein